MTAVAFAATAPLHAQKTYNDTVRTHTWSVYVQGGVGSHTTLRGSTHVDGKKMLAPNAALGVKYNIKPWIRIGLNAGWNMLRQGDQGTLTSTVTNPNFTISGKTGTLTTRSVRLQDRETDHLVGLDLNFDLNFMDIWHHRRAQKFNLWLGAGIGVIKNYGHFNDTWAYDESAVASGSDHMNIYEHEYITSSAECFHALGMYIPLSLSAEWDLAPHWTVGAIGQYKIIPTNKDCLPKSLWSAGVVVRYNFVGHKQGIYSWKEKYSQLMDDLSAARMAQENCERSSAELQKMLDEANAKARALQNDNDRLRNQPKPVAEKVAEGGIVYFSNDSKDLDDNAMATIKKVAEGLKSDSGRNIILVGSANTPGSMSYNKKLSEKRVSSVREALINEGVKESQIKETYAVGEYGMNADEVCRRVIITLE